MRQSRRLAQDAMMHATMLPVILEGLQPTYEVGVLDRFGLGAPDAERGPLDMKHLEALRP